MTNVPPGWLLNWNTHLLHFPYPDVFAVDQPAISPEVQVRDEPLFPRFRFEDDGVNVTSPLTKFYKYAKEDQEYPR